MLFYLVFFCVLCLMRSSADEKISLFDFNDSNDIAMGLDLLMISST